MKIKKRFGIVATFATMLLVTIVFMPAVSAVAVNDKSDIISNIDFDKKSLTKFNETLDNFETVTTNPTAFLNDVSDGRVTLVLLGQKFDLELQEMHIVSDDAKLIAEDGSVSDAPKAYSYKGTVVGKANSNVVLTAGDGVLIGEIKVDNKSYVIEQTSKKYNNKVIHVVYTSDAIKKRKILEYNTDVVIGDQKDLSTRLNQTQIAALLLSTPTVDVMACYDSEFASLFSNPTAEIQNMMATVASAFSPGNVNLNIKAYRYYTNIANGNAQAVLTNFGSAAANDRDSTNSDLAFLFSGKEFSDSNIGISNTYNGNSNAAYGVAQMVRAGLLSSYQATSSQRKSVTAHELGHNFGATHNEAYDYYILGSHYYTSMWTPFQGGSAMKTEFSNLNNHGDSTHNNILHIVANKNTIAGFQ
jgi:hypothetical protein